MTNPNLQKPIKAKPNFYAICFQGVKEIGIRYGYNIVLHGSLDRDIDFVAIPWVEDVGVVDDMLEDIAKLVGGHVLKETTNRSKPHGRISYIINIHRAFELEHCGMFLGNVKEYLDPQYYIDISVMPTKSKLVNDTIITNE